ncbi:MAG: hypothetical protein IPJ06_13995 [Saprospiraceae bacterium]|nr:hypothetical protein [Saprospiraceae bacterium]
MTFEQIAINGPQGDISISQGVKSTDNGLLYTGEWVDYNQGLMRTFLVKYDTALNVLWMNTFPELEDPDRVYYGTDICMTKEGEILSYGSCGVYDQSKQIASVAYILKTDSLGKLLWYKELDDDFIETLAYGNLTPTSDGNYLFSTLARYPLPTGNWMRVYYQYVKINGDGDVLWKKVLIDVPNDNQLPFTTATVDGGFVAAMQKDTFLADKGFGPFRNLRWYDQNEVLKKEYHWNNWSYRYSTNDLLTTQNGEIISVGIVVTDAGRGQSFIERYSPEGELIWERIYNDSLARPGREPSWPLSA